MHTHLGAMWYSGGKLAVGSVSGALALWGVGPEERGRGRDSAVPSLSQENELQLESGIFSLSFDADMKLVSTVEFLLTVNMYLHALSTIWSQGKQFNNIHSNYFFTERK